MVFIKFPKNIKHSLRKRQDSCTRHNSNKNSKSIQIEIHQAEQVVLTFSHETYLASIHIYTYQKGLLFNLLLYLNILYAFDDNILVSNYK